MKGDVILAAVSTCFFIYFVSALAIATAVQKAAETPLDKFYCIQSNASL